MLTATRNRSWIKYCPLSITFHFTIIMCDKSVPLSQNSHNSMGGLDSNWERTPGHDPWTCPA